MISIMSNTPQIYNINHALMFGFCDSPDEMVIKYGF